MAKQRIWLMSGILYCSCLIPAIAQQPADLQPVESVLKAAPQGEWVGKPVPNFRLQDQSKKWHSPAQYKGKWLVIYFYPKDGTAGCTEEAKQFRDLYPEFKKANAAVLGVSMDDVASHQKFSNELGLPFPILADDNGQLTNQFGIIRNFAMIKVAKRESFLIDPKGIIVYHYSSVKSQTHAQQVLDDIKKLSPSASTAKK